MKNRDIGKKIDTEKKTGGKNILENIYTNSGKNINSGRNSGEKDIVKK